MVNTFEGRKNHLLNEVIARVTDKIPSDQVENVTRFVEYYYQSVAPEDLIDRSVLDLYGGALAHWNLCGKRSPGKRLVRVYNPRMDEHGWQSTHTIIEIVQDDMPFLVDSTSVELNRLGLTVHLIIHPVMHIRRSATHLVQEVTDGTETNDAKAEAVLRFEVDRQADDAQLQALEKSINRALDDVRYAVEDWPAMRERLREIVSKIKTQPPALNSKDVAEDLAFLDWLDRDHFIYLGFADYELVKENGDESLRMVNNAGLGIFRTGRKAHDGHGGHLPPQLREEIRKPGILVLTKTNTRSSVHRPAYMDYVGIKRTNQQGEIVGEWRFLGLYTSAAYISRPRDIPLLRRKVQHIIEKSGFRPAGHSSKALVNILETLPRDELFQATEEQLSQIATAILHLQERQRVRLLVRRDPYGRFISCLVFLPRERFNTQIRLRIQNILKYTFNAHTVDFSVALSESVLARIHFIAHVHQGEEQHYDVADLEARILHATHSWEDELYGHLISELGENQGNVLATRYRGAFPASYSEDYAPPIAVADIRKMEELQSPDQLGMTMYQPLETPQGAVRFKLFRRGEPIYLSMVLPMLENMGVRVLDERPHEIKLSDGEPVWVHDLGLVYDNSAHLNSEEVRTLFQDAFAALWNGRIENDGFNKLVLFAQLSWRQVEVLRACCKYVRQTGFTFSQAYMEQALVNHPQIACLLVNLFTTRLDPSLQDKAPQRAEILLDSIEKSLDAVPNLDEDRIQRRFFTLIKAVLRSNYFQTQADGETKPYLSFKIDSSQIPDIPEPKPLYEIFVYSPYMEGIHLRGGRVARGGLRWSDRLEDFRTEVFDLMKTQMVKNAVIVPVGAKGGFVVKQPPADGDSDALGKEVVRCYTTLIRGLLDITDNLIGGKVSPPPNVVRYDCDDPYLVVAADKGTASFSDIANSISKEYNFWLGDAFASGGSAGYDHKKIAITARGGWESVKRHFREINVNTQTDDFTVVGIGSMNGDVFGNGMILSRHIKLLGAFSHKHIFIDPNPDIETSFVERERLFNLPRSSWTDYDKKLISPGGGIFNRSAKSIPISTQARQALDITAEQLTPNELIQALLKAPVDLIWNGGIGTFVKARGESHVDVGDRSNDAIRVNGDQLRCKAFGEGGNLGLTAKGRIEYARSGGRINTDFIDNSGGVDCSDHEVNIKILLDEVVKAGDLSEKQRNDFLATMTDEVADAVLHNNYQQTQALSLSEYQGFNLLDEQVRLMRFLEKLGRLDRNNWSLPNDEELAKRRIAEQGLTRPELSVLLAFSKIEVFEALVSSDLCEEPYLVEELVRYFPDRMRANYREHMSRHRLRREIIATFVANNMINRMGITFALRIREHTGATSADVARAYLVTRHVFQLPELWAGIEGLDNAIPAEKQLLSLLTTRKLVNRATLWFLRNCRQPLDIAATIDAFRDGVAELMAVLPDLLDEGEAERLNEEAKKLIESGIPEHLAVRISALPTLFSGLDICEVATGLTRSVSAVARLYFHVGAALELYWLREHITGLPEDTRWSRLARSALRDDLYRLHRTVTRETMLLNSDCDDPAVLFNLWRDANQVTVERYLQNLAEFKASDTSDLALLSVAVNDARKLIQTSGAAKL